jgi:hypothetical protein
MDRRLEKMRLRTIVREREDQRLLRNGWDTALRKQTKYMPDKQT